MAGGQGRQRPGPLVELGPKRPARDNAEQGSRPLMGVGGRWKGVCHRQGRCWSLGLCPPATVPSAPQHTLHVAGAWSSNLASPSHKPPSNPHLYHTLPLLEGHQAGEESLGTEGQNQNPLSPATLFWGLSPEQDSTQRDQCLVTPTSLPRNRRFPISSSRPYRVSPRSPRHP